MAEMTLADLAKHAYGFFEYARRPGAREDDEGYYRLKDERPVWLVELVKSVHRDGQWLPDDYKFKWTAYALEQLGDGADPDEGPSGRIEPDVYNGMLVAWLGSHLNRGAYVDEASENFGHSSQGIYGDLAQGQMAEIEEVWHLVVRALNKRLEEIERGDDEEEMERRGRRGAPDPWGPRKQDWNPRRGGN